MLLWCHPIRWNHDRCGRTLALSMLHGSLWVYLITYGLLMGLLMGLQSYLLELFQTHVPIYCLDCSVHLRDSCYGRAIWPIVIRSSDLPHSALLHWPYAPPSFYVCRWWSQWSRVTADHGTEDIDDHLWNIFIVHCLLLSVEKGIKVTLHHYG